jgi:cytochrome c
MSSSSKVSSFALVFGVGSLLLAGAAQAGDAAAGKAVFTAQCGTCHTVTKGGPTLVGPNLFGVVGRKAGSLSGFAYSPAMKAAGFSWTVAKLADYAANPAGAVPGNKMPFGGVKGGTKAADVAAYLATLK